MAGELLKVAVSYNPGGIISVIIKCEKSVVRDLCITAVSLYGIYSTSKLVARAIDGIVNRGLGGPRKDQVIDEIQPGSLHVKLRCFTDERFLEVWTDYESESMKKRLQEEFSQSGIEVEGLKIEIENLEEVNDTKKAIENRRSLNGQTEIDRKYKEEELMKEMDNKLDEIKANQQRIEDNMKNLKLEIIDEIRGSATPRKRSRASMSQSTSGPEEVIVMGGSGKGDTVLASVEKMQLGQSDTTWVALAAMTVPRSHAASVVIGTQIIVNGGGTDSIEILDVGQRPLQWIKSKAVLPFYLLGHSSLVYQGKLIVIGGYNASEGSYSDEIHEVLLSKPYSSKLLCKLPKPIGYLAAEMINDKIFLFGGKKDGLLCDDVMEYDPARNEVKVVSKLPYPLRYASSVQWENKVILIGGEKGSDIPLKEVIMFDIKSGKFSMLPSMNHARRGFSAIITGDLIVVMGGYGSRGRTRSVECYDVSAKTWKDLPSMKEARGHPTALVCPKL
ncbi:kinase [Paramuricea clavata]|uniref:Kinase n=1 Tax=Paramuricea clavata TaxID=317549 RepID=A0A7D9DZP2_PARCT|nr:kinase [Paramuricea clavata]